MHGGGVHSAELVFLSLLAFVAIFAAIARKLQRPYPIVLVIAGLLLSFFPRVPKVELNPDIIFLIVLPPLLYSAAWTTSWRDFRYNLVSISMLAIGLVTATVLGVARTARFVFPGFTWQLGFVLGAVVSTTDAIAATSIARRVGLPQRVVDVLEGESLVNDATGLVALEFGLAMVMRSQTPTVPGALLRLAFLLVVGIAIGLLIAKLVEWFEKYRGRRPNRDCGQHSGPLRGVPGRRSRARFRCARCSGVRALSQPAQRPLLLAASAAAGLGGVGRDDLRAERAGIRADRIATAVRDGRHPLLQRQTASALRRNVSARSSSCCVSCGCIPGPTLPILYASAFCIRTTPCPRRSRSSWWAGRACAEW